MSSKIQTSKTPTYLSVKETAAQPDCPFTESSLRHLIYYAESRTAASGEVVPGNGLNRALVRIGRKVLIDQVTFQDWIASHRISNPHW